MSATFVVTWTMLTRSSYGVSRVYSHQCGYMLNDMHSFRDKMRGIEQVMKELEIDPDVGKTR